jgi:hypothetical protein
VGLRIILDEFEVVFLAELPYPISIGATAIEMDYHNSSGTLGDSLLDETVVNLKSIDIRFYENRSETILCNGEDAGDIGIGRYDDFVTLLHKSHFLISTEDERECIKSIATTYTMTCADILGIVLLKTAGSLAFEVPPTLQHFVGNMLVGFVDGFQV